MPLQNEDLLFSTAGVRCVIGKVRSSRFDRCTVELLETTKSAGQSVITEQSPSIDDAVIAQFRARFANYEVSKPAICNGLDKCSIFKVNPSSPMSPELAAHEPDDVSAVDTEAA